MKSICLFLGGMYMFSFSQSVFGKSKRPNILFVIADDQSYPYSSAYGDKDLKTPAFDKVAKNGCLFTNAFVTSPGSSPSRASILTGKYPWQIAEAGTHSSDFPIEYECFPDMLKESGYHIGFTGKGWAPGNIGKRPYNPAGPSYNKAKLKPPYNGISSVDYAENFKLFLEEKDDNQPFYFWYGALEPHRTFQEGSWKQENKKLDDANVPPYLPKADIIKGDILDYDVEIEWFDKHLQKILDILEAKGELENTLIIVTADNGMSFPAAKANCYEYGTHVPLAICWGKEIRKGQVIDNLVTSVDFAPTILEAAGISKSVYKDMAGKSMLSALKGEKNYTNKSVFFGRERHSSSRYNNLGYPIRAIRTDNYLYIRNYHPERWPAGDPCLINPDGSLSKMHTAYKDIDGAPSKDYLIENRDNVDVFPYFLLAVAKRPYEELYKIDDDPGCLKNLVGKIEYEGILNDMRSELTGKLKDTHDTRNVMVGDKELWETYPRRANIRKFPKPLF